LAPAIRAAIGEVDPYQSISVLRGYDELAARSTARPRSLSILLRLFAGLGLFLGAAGVYGVVGHAVAQGRRETGIRVALGARRAQVVVLALRRAITPVLVGIAAGLAGAVALGRLLSSFLFEVRATDSWTYFATPVLLLLVALGAALVPSLQAARIHPVAALRDE
jgi:ABC-type antimicrobial peptide transport system permease subunit